MDSSRVGPATVPGSSASRVMVTLLRAAMMPISIRPTATRASGTAGSETSTGTSGNRGSDLGGSSDKIDVARVSGLLGLFVAVVLGANWIGLAVCLGIGTGVATLLFPGEKPLLRAVATGFSFWLIAWGLFGKLLDLPLP